MQEYSIRQVNKQLNISRTTLYKYIKKLKINTVKKKNKTYLSKAQVQKIEEEIKNKNTTKNRKENTVCTLKHKITAKNIRIIELEKEQEILKSNVKKIETQNIEFRTKAKTLEEQNNKIIFQIGRATEKIIMLENEKLREIEIRSEKLKQGFFRKTWEFLTKTP
jgi:transposase